MKRSYSLITSILICAFVYAGEVKTTYSKGTFHTNKTVTIDADFNRCSMVIDSFITDFQTNPPRLFEWAFKGLGQTHRNDGSDDIVLKINSTYYNPDSAKSVINADFVMSNGFTIRNKDLMSYVHDYNQASTRRIEVEFYYSGMLLKRADGTFILTRLDTNHTQASISIDIRFGWFFNIFVTQRRHREVIEWRISRFVDNIKTEAEKKSND